MKNFGLALIFIICAPLVSGADYLIEPGSDGSSASAAATSCLTPAVFEKLQKSAELYTRLLEKNALTWKRRSNLFYETRVRVAATMAGFGNSGRPYIQMTMDPKTYVLNEAVTAFNQMASSQVQYGGGCTNAHYQVEQFNRDVQVIFTEHKKARIEGATDCIIMAYHLYGKNEARLKQADQECDAKYGASYVADPK